MGQINEAVVRQGTESEQPPQEVTTNSSTPGSRDDDEPPLPPNAGQLIVDASCAPCDSRYPTDLSLLNQAREHTEAIIDTLYEQVRSAMSQKPRTYRNKARQQYLQVAKQRQVQRKALRKVLNVNYLGRVTSIKLAGCRRA